VTTVINRNLQATKAGSIALRNIVQRSNFLTSHRHAQHRRTNTALSHD